MKKFIVNIILKNKSTFFNSINFTDFEDDVRNRRAIVRTVINNNKLRKTIIPYEAIEYITFTELEV